MKIEKKMVNTQYGLARFWKKWKLGNLFNLRFDISLRSEELFRAVKQKVAEIIDDENPEMFWTGKPDNTHWLSPGVINERDFPRFIFGAINGWFSLKKSIISKSIIHYRWKLKHSH